MIQINHISNIVSQRKHCQMKYMEIRTTRKKCRIHAMYVIHSNAILCSNMQSSESSNANITKNIHLKIKQYKLSNHNTK